MQSKPSIIIADTKEVTKIPDHIGAVVNPTQSYASPNCGDPFKRGCTWKSDIYERGKIDNIY